MIRILFISISIFFATLLNAAVPKVTTQIVALQGEVGEVVKVNLLRFFSDADDVSGKPTTMKFSLGSGVDWISIDGINIRIAATKNQHLKLLKIIATDESSQSVYQNIKILVPNKKSNNPDFPLINIPYIHNGDYIIRDGINDNNPVVESRINLKVGTINCSALIDQIPSLSEISSGIFNRDSAANKYYEYMFPKSGSGPSNTIPWNYITENNNYTELFSSQDATDEYKKLIQQNQVCEVQVDIESGKRFAEVYSKTYTDNSPDKIDQIIGNQMTSMLSSYANKLEINVNNITNDGYGDTGYTVSGVSEIISLHKKDFSNFSSFICSVYNGNYEIEMDIFRESYSYRENPSFFELEIDKVIKISNGETNISKAEKDDWDSSCMNIPDPIPRAHPQGRGIESAKALYSLGYRNIPQTKEDGKYDMGIENLDFDRGYQKTTHFASIKKGSKAYMSSGIQNGPSKFQYEDSPKDLERVVYDLVYKDMKNHSNFNAYVGNKSANPNMKGMIMIPNSGKFSKTSKEVVFKDLSKVISTDEYLVANNKADTGPASAWEKNFKESNVYNDFVMGAVGNKSTILDLYNRGYNWDNGKCKQAGDSSCIFAFSLYLNDDQGGMYLKPVSASSGGDEYAVIRTLGSPLTKENQLAETKEMMDSYSGMKDIPNGYLDVGQQSSLSKLKGKAIKSDMYYSLTYDQMKDGDFGYMLDGLGLLLPPGYFYSGETKRLNTYSFLQLKTPRYAKTNAGYDSYVFTDGGDDLLNSTNTTGKSLISKPRITPTAGYCSGLGLDYKDGNCVGEPCKTKGLKFNKMAGICEIEDANFDVDSKDSMCEEPPMFKPVGVEELDSSIKKTKDTGGRLHQTIKDGGYCNTTIPVKRLPTSCMEIKDSQPNSKDGEYNIFIGDKKTKVYCDMNTDNGGWTLAIRDPDGIVPSSCAYCHLDNVWPGSDLVNPDLPDGKIVTYTYSKPEYKPKSTVNLKNAYKGLPFYTIRPASILYKSYSNKDGASNRNGTRTKQQIFSGTNKVGFQYQSLSQVPAPTKTNNGPLLTAHNIRTYQYRKHHENRYWEEMYVRDDSFPIRIKEIINTPDRWSAYTRNQSLPDPRDGGDNGYYEYSEMPTANFPYLTTALEAGEDTRAGGKYVLLVEAMDRIDTNWSGNPDNHPGRNIRTRIIISEPGTYSYKFAIIHQSNNPDVSCKKKPYVEIKTQSETYMKSKCIKDVAPGKVEWIEDTFRTTEINEEVIVTVHAVAEHRGDWAGTRLVIPHEQEEVNFNNISTASLTAVNLCGSGYSLTADLSACQHTEYSQCPVSNTQLITNNGITTCGKLPDSCSISELEIKITETINEYGNPEIINEYGACKFPAFPETSIDVIKNISSRIFYNKFIKENNGLITPSDLNGLEISSEYKDILIGFEKDLNEEGKSIWDMDSDNGEYINLNKALSRSSDYIDSSDLKQITDSYEIDNKSKKRFVKSVGILKENLPEFAIDAMAVSYGVMAHRIRDLPVRFGSKIKCKDGEIEAYDADFERVCINTISSIDDISKYKWNAIEQDHDANFKLEINGNTSRLMLESTKSIVMDFGDSIPISSKDISSLILSVMNKDISGASDSLIRSVINCKEYKLNISTPVITKESGDNTNGEGVIYGSLNCKLPDLSYSNTAISRFSNEIETDETSNLQDLEVISELGLMEINKQIKACKEDVGGSDRFGSYKFTTWKDVISKQEYEKRANFKPSISLYMPKKLTNSYIREIETNKAATKEIAKIVGTISHASGGDLLRDEEGSVIFDGMSGIFSNNLTKEGFSVIANQINAAVQGSFPYKSQNISIMISTDIFKDSISLGKGEIENIANFTYAVDSKYSDKVDPLKTVFLSEDGFVGVRNDIVIGSGTVTKYKSEISTDGKEKVIAIKVPGFKKILNSDLSSSDSLLDRLGSVFPEECSHLNVDGYKDINSYDISREYSDTDKYVSTSKDSPEYKNISNFLIGPAEKTNYIYFNGYGNEIMISEKIHLDTEVELIFEYKTIFKSSLTKEASVWSINQDGSNPRSLIETFEITNVDSPTQQEMTCKVSVEGVCGVGEKILNEDIGKYYYSNSSKWLGTGISANFTDSGEIKKIKSGDKVVINKGDYFNLILSDAYAEMDYFRVVGTDKVLVGASESPEAINNPQYSSLYYKDTLDKFGDIKDLYFSRFSGGELSISVDKNKYDKLDTSTRQKCDMIYGTLRVNDDRSSYNPSISASISDEMVVDYQRVDILKAEEVSSLTTDKNIISSPNILSQLKCTERGLKVNGNSISCNSSFERSIKFSNFEIRNIFNGNVILDGQVSLDLTGIASTEDIAHSSLNRLHSGETTEYINFKLNTNIKLDSIATEYTTSDINSVYDVAEDNVLGLVEEVLKYNPDYRLYINADGFDRYTSGRKINFNMNFNTDITDISAEMETSINIANNACLSVSNFDQSIVDEMAEKNKFYMVMKSMLDMNGVTDELNIPKMNNIGSQIKPAEETQSYKLFKGWGSPSQSDIARYYRATVSAEDALIQDISSKCKLNSMYLADAMEAGIQADNRTGLFCKLATDFLFYPAGDKYVFEPKGSASVGVRIEIPSYKNFNFDGAEGFNSNMMTALVNKNKMYEEQGINFFKKTHHFVLNSRNNLFTQVMKGIALHEFEYKKQMAGIVNIDFLGECVTRLGQDGIYEANISDISLKRAFSGNGDGIKTLIPAVLSLGGLESYNNYSPIKSIVETDAVAPGYSVSSEGSGHVENNSVKLYKSQVNSGLYDGDADGFCRNIMVPKVLVGNDYIDAANLEVLAGASSRGSATISVKVPRVMSNADSQHKYVDLLGNPNWLQDKVCKDGYEEVGIRLDKRKLSSYPDQCDGGLSSGLCAQAAAPTFGFLDAIKAMFGSKAIQREMNEYNKNGIMKIVKICGIGSPASADAPFATPLDNDTEKRKIVILNSGTPSAIFEGNVLLGKAGVDKAKINMQVLYSDVGIKDPDGQAIKQNQRSLVINSINLFNTITNKKTGKDRSLGYVAMGGDSLLSLDTGSPVENLVNSCIKFKGKVSYRKPKEVSGFKLDSSHTDKSGVCSISPRDNLDIFSCNEALGKWTSKIPLIKTYPNSKEDFSFIDPRNGQQRAVRACSDIFLESEEVFNEELAGGDVSDVKRDAMVRHFEKSITGCGNTGEILNEEEAKKKAAELREKTMSELVLTCGINSDIETNPNASEMLAKELSSFEKVSSGSYGEQSEDGVFRTKVGRDKNSSFGALQNKNFKSGDFSKTPSVNNSAEGKIQESLDNLDKSSAQASGTSGFATGLVALAGILETIGSIPGVDINKGMVSSIKTAVKVVGAISVVKMVSDLSNAKDMAGGGAAVKAANEMKNESFGFEKEALSQAEMGFNNATVGEYVDKVINFDKSMLEEAKSQDLEQSIKKEEYQILKKEYESKRSDAESKLYSQTNNGLGKQLEEKSKTPYKYDHRKIEIIQYEPGYNAGSYYRDLETKALSGESSGGSVQRDYYRMKDRKYQNRIAPGALSRFEQENQTAGDINIENAYEKFTNMGGDVDATSIERQSEEYKQYNINQIGVTIEGFSR